jgi:hypothetical protein
MTEKVLGSGHAAASTSLTHSATAGAGDAMLSFAALAAGLAIASSFGAG